MHVHVKRETTLDMYQNSMNLLILLVFLAVKNGFKVESPKQQWFFATETQEEKFNMISLLEQTIRGAMQG